MMKKAKNDSDEELQLLSKSDSFHNYGDDALNKKESPGSVYFWQLFRFADTIDYVLLGFGLLACLVTSACTVAYIVVYGILAHAFASHAPVLPPLDYQKLNEEHCPSGIVLTEHNYVNMSKFCGLTTPASMVTDGVSLRDKVMPNIYLLLIIGGIEIISCTLQCILFEFACRRQINRIRVILFDCILKRDVVYFDTVINDSLNTHMIESVLIIEEAIGWEFSFVIADFFTLPALLVTAFVVNWHLASVLFIVGPFLIVSLWFFGKVTGRATYDELSSYRKANSVAEEALGSFRTVLSLNGIEFETRRYVNYLSETISTGKRKGVAFGIFNGVLSFLVISVYAMLFYFGAKMSHAYPTKSFLKDYLIIATCVMEIMFVAFEAGPYMESVAEATGAAIATFKIIDDSLDEQKLKKNARLAMNKPTPVMSRGEIVFKDVSFAYPRRSTKQVLSGLNLEAHSGKTIALVGSSGCGKSTCVQLLLRFYDKTSGSITVDGNPIEEYDIKQLRQSIGVVSQEPVLFATTVYENIRYGNENATQSDIEEAARQANADNFIRKLPNKYATLVGERGAHLSGGEKQRIALARALVRKPTLLILDEATSALDYKNEAIVQRALDRACKDRTTIIIAHRLSTIRKADIIYVIHDGTCVESGDHNTLIAQDGYYAKLYNRQTPNVLDNNDEPDEQHSEPSEEEEEEEDDENPEDSATKKRNYDDEYEEEYRSERFSGQSWTAFLEILKLNKPEWPFIAGGCLGSFIHGLMTIALTVLLGYSVKVLQDYNVDRNEKRLYFICFLFYLAGLTSFVCEFVTGYCFIYSGSALIRRLRAKAFRTMLRQEVAWHDDPENHVGALCGRLSNESMAIQKMTNIHLGMFLEAIGNWFIGLIFGLIVCWQLTLIVAGYILVICILAVFELRWSIRIYRQIEEFLEKFSSLSLEALENIRTIKQLTLEEKFLARYQILVNKLIRICRFYDFVSSIIRAFDMAALTFIVCALYVAALSMHEHGLLKSSNMIYAFGLVLYCLSASEAVSNMQQEWGETSMAASDFVYLFERDPEIDNDDATNGQVIPNFTGDIEFYRVQFSYPTRPDRLILNHFHLQIDAGQRVAIVGPSGSGKTSIIQLLERFYDPDKGELRLDGEDIRTVNLHWLRSQLGLVSQEPVLFDMTIRQNITYGLESFTEADVIAAAKKANIHELIQSLPKGYHTNVGLRGTQLSGGEKQRIAIARILIRRPRILLFDEATSAMDSYNEQTVQEALDRAAYGDDGEKRTTITIAHRLSTIESSDMIIVLDAEGHLAERPGTHEELMSRYGPYYYMQANRAF